MLSIIEYRKSWLVAVCCTTQTKQHCTVVPRHFPSRLHTARLTESSNDLPLPDKKNLKRQEHYLRSN